MIDDWDKLLLKRDEILAFHWPSEETYASWEIAYPVENAKEKTSTKEATSGSAPTP